MQSDLPIVAGDFKVAGDSTVVIGLGNRLMSDDAIGLLALERLETLNFDPPVGFVYGDTWGLALLPEIEGSDTVLLLDAIRANASPGTVHILPGGAIEEVLSPKISPHQIDVRELLALARLRDHFPRRLAAIGVEPAAVELNTELSPAVRASLAAMVTAAVDQLAAWGHRCIQPAE
jgi:hydrogenase maturation protease